MRFQTVSVNKINDWWYDKQFSNWNTFLCTKQICEQNCVFIPNNGYFWEHFYIVNFRLFLDAFHQSVDFLLQFITWLWINMNTVSIEWSVDLLNKKLQMVNITKINFKEINSFLIFYLWTRIENARGTCASILSYLIGIEMISHVSNLAEIFSRYFLVLFLKMLSLHFVIKSSKSIFERILFCWSTWSSLMYLIQ